jgi:hypothetical protein
VNSLSNVIPLFWRNEPNGAWAAKSSACSAISPQNSACSSNGEVLPPRFIENSAFCASNACPELPRRVPRGGRLNKPSRVSQNRAAVQGVDPADIRRRGAVILFDPLSIPLLRGLCPRERCRLSLLRRADTGPSSEHHLRLYSHSDQCPWEHRTLIMRGACQVAWRLGDFQPRAD